MRILASLAIVICLFSSGPCKADDSIPTALYNPADGTLLFDNLDVLVDAGGGSVTSVIAGADFIGLALSPFPGSSFAYQLPGSVYRWEMEVTHDFAITEPLLAGYVIPVGIDSNDLSISLGYNTKGDTAAGDFLFRQIPEPSTVSLLSLCSMLTVAWRRRKHSFEHLALQ